MPSTTMGFVVRQNGENCMAVLFGCHGEDPVAGGERNVVVLWSCCATTNQQADHLANKAMDEPEEGTVFVPERLPEERGLSAALS